MTSRGVIDLPVNPKPYTLLEKWWFYRKESERKLTWGKEKYPRHTQKPKKYPTGIVAILVDGVKKDVQNPDFEKNTVISAVKNRKCV